MAIVLVFVDYQDLERCKRDWLAAERPESMARFGDKFVRVGLSVWVCPADWHAMRRDHVTAALDRSGILGVALETDPNTVLGWAAVSLDSERQKRLEWVHVDRPARRLGLGTALIQRVGPCRHRSMTELGALLIAGSTKKAAS